MGSAPSFPPLLFWKWGNEGADPNLFHAGDETIADAVDGLQVCRLLGSGLNFLSNPADINIHASRRDRSIVSPYPIQQLITRKHQTGMRCKMMKQPKLQGA